MDYNTEGVKNPAVTHVYVILKEKSSFFFCELWPAAGKKKKKFKLQNVFGFLSLFTGQEII